MAISTATTPGQVLTSAYVNNNINSGLVYIKQQTIGTGVSSVPVTGAFSTDYDNYRITISGVAISATDNSWFMTLGGSAGATYSYAGNYMAYTSATVNGLQASAGATGLWLGLSGGTSSVSIDVHSPFLAKATNYFGQSSGSKHTNTFQGYDSNAASSTAFTLTQLVATMTGGIITVYGYRKA